MKRSSKIYAKSVDEGAYAQFAFSQKVGGGTLTCCGEEMKCVTENLTAVNLMKAFAGESQARNKYELYGDLAKEAGYHAIARHFYEAAENEKWHARLNLRNITS